MFYFALVSIFLLSFGDAQQTPKCLESPEKWSGNLYIIRVAGTRAYWRISLTNYDRTNQKIKYTDIDVGDGLEKRSILEDYQGNVRYISTAGKCNTQPLTDSFPSLGVPEGATLDGPAEYLGSSEPGLGILVAQYTSLVNGFSYYIGHPISDGTQCIPIMTSVATIQPLEEVITEYTNITTTLPQNPFDVPIGCAHMKNLYT